MTKNFCNMTLPITHLQVGMIMYVRLKVLKQLKPQQYALAHKYFLFLGKRTKLNEEDRYKLSFHHK